MQLLNLNQMKDSELLETFSMIVKNEKETTTLLILHLSEIDKRGLYAKEGFSSLFSYCIERFHFSEEAAYRRIQAARLSQKFPQILELLEEGKVNLTTINLISPHLTADNKDQLLKEIQLKSKRGVEKIIATHFPALDDGKDIIRKLPRHNERKMESKEEMKESVTFAGEGSLPNLKADLPQMPSLLVLNMNQRAFQSVKKPDEIKPIATNRVKIEFRAEESVAEMIERARQLLRHKYPDGRLEDIFREVLGLFLDKKDPERRIQRIERKIREVEGEKALNRTHKAIDEGAIPLPASEEKITLNNVKGKAKPHKHKISTRYISQPMKLEIWKRDGGQCTFVSKNGSRCNERGMLELDHVEPWALGGGSTLENLRLLCRTHNQWRARQTFGAPDQLVKC